VILGTHGNDWVASKISEVDMLQFEDSNKKLLKAMKNWKKKYPHAVWIIHKLPEQPIKESSTLEFLKTYADKILDLSPKHPQFADLCANKFSKFIILDESVDPLKVQQILHRCTDIESWFIRNPLKFADYTNSTNTRDMEFHISTPDFKLSSLGSSVGDTLKYLTVHCIKRCSGEIFKSRDFFAPLF
jgi:hypothetical protein